VTEEEDMGRAVLRKREIVTQTSECPTFTSMYELLKRTSAALGAIGRERS